MFRVLLVLAAIPLGLLLLDSQRSGGLLATGSGARVSAFDKPLIQVLGSPSDLTLDESGVVLVRAEAPARPGDTIYLESAGAYGMGYYRVDKAVLDGNLQATLTVAGRPYLGTYKYWAKIAASGTYQEGKSPSISIRIGAAAAPGRPLCGRDDPVKPDGEPWICTYDDEFEGTKLDRRYWSVQETRTSGVVTGTKSTYACAVDDPETIRVEGGNLELSLVDRGKKVTCGRSKSSRYAFGQVTHFQKFAQAYGKYEIRAKIPDIRTPGVQQSFWLWPKKNSYGNWPASGEIDIAEMYSMLPGVDRPFIHYLPGAGEKGTNKNVTHADCAIKVGEFNTYGIEWRPGQIIVLLNGDVCFINDYRSVMAGVHGTNSPFDKPFFLALNQAMGTVGNEYDPDVVPDEVTTQIDYVRIWK